jgi:hypothetical protein
MIGDCLSRVAQRLVREETYATIVAPAIADLQFEAVHGSRSQVVAYTGVWRAIAGAVIDEVCTDARYSFSPARIGQIALLASATIAAILAIHMWVFEWNWGFKPLENLELTGWLLPSLLVSAGPVVLFPAGAILARQRRRGDARALVLIASVASMFLLLAFDYAVTETNQRWRELAYAREGHEGPPARGANERSTWELSGHRDRRSRIEVHFRLAFCASTIGWALIGLGLRRAGKNAIVVLGVVAYGLALVPNPVVRSGIRGWPQLPEWMPWVPTVLLVALGTLAARTRPLPSREA